MITLMFRTRDFILIFTTIVFLVLAIGSTSIYQSFIDGRAGEAIKFVDTDNKDYGVEIEVNENDERANRLAEMKSKIAASGDLSFSAPVTEASEEVVATLETTEPEQSAPISCDNYSTYNGVWPNNAKLAEVEGARIAFTESEVEKEIMPATASSSAVMGTEVVKNVLLQLSLYPFPQAKSTCLASDVIGIAQEGSLIRNDEAGLYSVFGSDTLIGFALDGFPIYGLSDESGDVCGGRMVNGRYVYYLSKDREVIINCFKGLPAKL